MSALEKFLQHERVCEMYAVAGEPCTCGCTEARAEYAALLARVKAAEQAVDEARKVIDDDLQWFVKYADRNRDYRAHDRYLDCRKWWIKRGNK